MNIDWVGMGIGFLIACWGVTWVIEAWHQPPCPPHCEHCKREREEGEQ